MPVHIPVDGKSGDGIRSSASDGDYCIATTLLTGGAFSLGAVETDGSAGKSQF